MSAARDASNHARPRPRPVQDYLDETPVWPDGTVAPASPMTRMQRRIWALAIAGKFFEGFVVFVTGVALPLIAREFSLTAAQHGMVGAASLLGILVGAAGLGGLADRFGRRPIFIAEMAVFAAFLVLILFTQSLAWLLACLFGMGLALGCDYPTAHLVISESANTGRRGRLVLSAFGFQSVGALAGMAVGFLILDASPTLDAWRWMYATAIVPAVVVALGRVFVTESPHWLVSRGDARDAEREMGVLLRRDPPYPTSISLSERVEEAGMPRAQSRYADLFDKHNRRATILASVPWFLQDLGTYGIGIFTPTLLAAAVGHQNAYARNVSDIVANDIVGAKGAALVDLLLLIGIAGAVLLADRVGRIKLQIAGFVGCAARLAIAANPLMRDETRGSSSSSPFS